MQTETGESDPLTIIKEEPEFENFTVVGCGARGRFGGTIVLAVAVDIGAAIGWLRSALKISKGEKP
jgi:hypothetical protein